MAQVIRCDNCGKEKSYPVHDWYQVSRFVYPDHTSREAQTGPWHLCSMKCVGDLFSKVQNIKGVEKIPVYSPHSTFV